MCKSHIHCGVDLRHRLIIGGKLVDLHPVAYELAGDFDFELGQLTLRDGIRLGDDWNNINLELRNEETINAGRHDDAF